MCLLTTSYIFKTNLNHFLVCPQLSEILKALGYIAHLDMSLSLRARGKFYYNGNFKLI